MNGDVKSKNWRQRLQECSLQDTIAIYLPYMVLGAIMAICACYIHDPTMRLLLYSALPESYQTRLCFGICFMEEMRFVLVMVGVAVPVLQLQVISLDLINTYLQMVLSSNLTQ